jgi:hypothetical protein
MFANELKIQVGIVWENVYLSNCGMSQDSDIHGINASIV